MSKKGILVVVSGPSGAGKGTVIAEVMKRSDKFDYSVSATTRPPRPGEVDGVHYHFIDHDAFENLIMTGMTLEYTEYSNNYYGTLRSSVEGKLDEGRNVMLEIEVDGAMQIKTKFPDAVLIMVIPPDYKTLEKRLRDRATNDEDDINRRLLRACDEMRFFYRYDYYVVNRDGEAGRAAEELIGIVESETRSTRRNPGFTTDFFIN